ncbi:MAG TPA: ATP-binding protein, partial [Xanthobacteraceae bacterium]|nr:ATP-binding protein [Xanthobacteraceae bacterium]
ILLNLLANAIKFTTRGGRITVRARAEPATMLLSVEDNGIGIGEDDLPRIGDPFFQARSSYDRSHGGSGLGLSIVKGLVDLHGGDVEICSRVGEGTRVLVRLPLSSKPRGAQTISIARSAADQARSDAAAPVKKSA